MTAQQALGTASAVCRLSLDGSRAGPRVKSAQRAMGRMRARPKVDEARDILANVVVCHVPVIHYNFQQKVQPPLMLSVKHMD